MNVIKCSWVRVRNKERRQILHWTKPLFGSLVVYNQDRRILIKRRGLFGLGTKTYLSSTSETVETHKLWWDIL